MRALVVYESMYGNTHQVAEAIGTGLETAYEVSVVPVSHADPALLDAADLVVVGGPTHIHGMSRPGTRKGAVEAAAKPMSPLHVEPDALSPGLREWFGSLDRYRVKAAAFDTRLHGPAALTGRASKGIANLLRKHGFEVIAPSGEFPGDQAGPAGARRDSPGSRMGSGAGGEPHPEPQPAHQALTGHPRP